MPCALTPAVIASLVELATFDAELGLRADARSTTVTSAGAPDSRRDEASALPSARVRAEGAGVRFDAAYVPRFWTSSGTGQQWVVTHVAEAQLGRREETSWSASVYATALRGTTAPLTSALAPDPRAEGAPPMDGQVPTTSPLTREELRTSALVELLAGPRTRISATAGWRTSRAIGADAALLPPQQGVAIAAAAARELTERDTLRLRVDVDANVTAERSADVRTGSAGASASWRRRLSPSMNGWVGAGAALLYSGPSSSTEVQPTAEVGADLAFGALSLTGALRLATFVDRYSGALAESVDAVGTLLWRANAHLAILGTGSAGTRLDGVTSLARGDLRATWAVAETFGVETGVLLAWQGERESTRPTFVEAGGYVGIVWTTGGLFQGDDRRPPGEVTR